MEIHRRLLLIVVVGTSSGCHDRGPQAAAFLPGNSVQTRPPRPEILIRVPESAIAVKPDKKIDLLVDVIVPEGTTHPLGVDIRLLSRKVTRNIGFLDPDRKEGNVFIYRGRLRAPHVAGQYQLSANALYDVLTHAGQGVGASTEPGHERVLFTEKGPTIQVTP